MGSETSTLTSRSRPPERFTSSSDGICSRRSCTSSATSFSCSSPYGPDMFTCMIGNSDRLNSITLGSSASAGSSGFARSTFSRTFWSASSMSMPFSNSATMDV